MTEDHQSNDQQQEPESGETQIKQAAAAPPWGTDDEFNPEKAWKLVQDLRADKDRLSARPVLTDEHKQKINEYDRLEQASKTDLERAQEERNRWQSEAEKWRATSVTSRIEAFAAPDFAYPADAVAKLDPAHYLDAGGVINEGAIKADLAALLEERPNWRRQSDTPKSRVPAPNPDQGSGGGGKPVADPRQEFAALLQSTLNGTR